MQCQKPNDKCSDATCNNNNANATTLADVHPLSINILTCIHSLETQSPPRLLHHRRSLPLIQEDSLLDGPHPTSAQCWYDRLSQCHNANCHNV
jgi:hypothetical protein